MTCCGVAYLVVATVAMMLTFASLWLPFVVLVENSSSTYDGTTSESAKAHALRDSPWVASHRAESITSRTKEKVRLAQEQTLSLSGHTLQCPFFNGPCYIGSTELRAEGIIVETDDLVAAAGCTSLGATGDPTRTRMWAVAAAFWSVVTWLMAIVHAVKGVNLGSHPALIKFGAAGLSAAHVLACMGAMILEWNVWSCFMDAASVTILLLPAGYEFNMYAVSLIIMSAGGGWQFWNGVGMVVSWFSSCCGAPAGRNSTVNVVFYTQMYEQPLGVLPPPQATYDAYGRLVQQNLQS
ncbi:membrane-associated protein, putative [Bodo saltans]|uniref:Membrane-associated protein, putative n=1 Tax=Bodo saltans TaxID=75058 RepID=A0A0S4IMG6_BODSA|nr:membrane-associated protein, putative [Bodo saltans]|eukprot:CUE65772.1 membrane-associated protein, putative [Bodo saltans]